MNKIIQHNPLSWTYFSDVAMLTEHFSAGRLLFAGMVDNGIRLTQRLENTLKSSFDIIIDEQSLNGGFIFEGFENENGDNGCETGILTLTHNTKPVKVKIVTKCAGFGFFQRHIEITNISETENVSLTDITPFTGRMWQMKDNVPENLAASRMNAYSIGRFIDITCYYEGNFAWQDIPVNTELAYRNKMGKSGWSNPFFALRNNITGGYFMCQMGWSSNWKMAASTEFYHTWGGADSALSLEFEIKPSSPSPYRVIMPGETIDTPEIHFGACHKDFDALIQNCHASLRQNILRRYKGGVPEVYFNHWGFVESHIDEEKVLNAVDIAAELEAELFIIDAGWYGNAKLSGPQWWDFTGDWHTSPDKFPNDLFPIFDRCREKGLKYGIWLEIESAGKYSETAKEHPDWIETRDGVRLTRKLDLSKSEPRAFVKSEMIRLIEKYKLDLVRIDFNIDVHDGGNRMVDSVNENVSWRNIEALYGIFEEMREMYPEVRFENCAGGGGRTDIGMVSRFSTTWVSDWMRMPRTVRILNGMSMVLPPEYINRMYGGAMEGYIWGDIETQLQAAVMAHLTLSSLSYNIVDMNADAAAVVKKYVRLYKGFIRPILPECLVYHHDPVIPGIDASGCALLNMYRQIAAMLSPAFSDLRIPMKTDITLNSKGWT